MIRLAALFIAFFSSVNASGAPPSESFPDFDTAEERYDYFLKRDREKRDNPKPRFVFRAFSSGCEFSSVFRIEQTRGYGGRTEAPWHLRGVKGAWSRGWDSVPHAISMLSSQQAPPP